MPPRAPSVGGREARKKRLTVSGNGTRIQVIEAHQPAGANIMNQAIADLLTARAAAVAAGGWTLVISIDAAITSIAAA